MRVTTLQSRYLAHIQSAFKDAALPDEEGSLFFVGVQGSLTEVEGASLLLFKDAAEKSTGIILFLDDVRFKVDKACDFTDNIKFFIDGIESILGRNVVIVGCPIDRTKSSERYILNEDRWPHKEIK